MSTSATLTAEERANLRQTVLDMSTLRLRRHLQLEQALDARPCDPFYGMVHGHWMAIILLAGPAFRLVFKAHFALDDVERLGAAAIQGLHHSSREVMLLDLMREYCNLVGGGLKGVAEKAGLRVGISLPLVTRGFDEVYFDYPELERPLGGQWILGTGQGSERIVCSYSLEARDVPALRAVTGLTAEADGGGGQSDGELELL